MLPVTLTCRPPNLPGCAERPCPGEMPRTWVLGQGAYTLSLHVSAKKAGVTANLSHAFGARFATWHGMSCHIAVFGFQTKPPTWCPWRDRALAPRLAGLSPPTCSERGLDSHRGVCSDGDSSAVWLWNQPPPGTYQSTFPGPIPDLGIGEPAVLVFRL